MSRVRISFRQAKINDLARIIFITKLSYRFPYKESNLTTKPHEPKNIIEQFTKKEFFIIAAIYNNKIIGAVRYKFDKNSNLYFYRLAVLKTFRNLGIGYSLICELEKIAFKKGCSKILLDCAQEKKLDEYYKKLGFKIDKIEPHLDHHDVYMSKKVKDSKRYGTKVL